MSSSDYASGGGLLRDSNGSRVKGFSRKIGTTSYLLAELWALRDGLIMARTIHVEEKLIINVGALEVINLLSNTKANDRLTQPIVNDCKNILQAFQKVHLQHCYRETNKVVDFLVKLGRRQSDPFVYYVTPPFGIMEALSDDANAILYNQTTRIVTDTYGGFKFGYRLKSQVILLFSLFLLLFRDDTAAG